MTLAAQLSADLRARSTFTPYCPLCSFPDHAILHRPSVRQFRGVWKVDSCCYAYATTEQFESEGEAVAWWRARRLEPLRDIATDRRRLNTLAKLAAANLEPIE